MPRDGAIIFGDLIGKLGCGSSAANGIERAKPAETVTEH